MKRIKNSLAVILCVLTMLTVFPLSSLAAVKPLKPELFTATNVTAETVDLTWLPSENATGYRIFVYLNGKWKVVKDTKSTATTITGLVASKTYTFAIRSARKVLGEIQFCDGYSQVKAKTKNLIGTTVAGTAGVDYVDLKWYKVPGASGYAVYQYNGSGWTLIGTTTRAYGRVKNLKGLTTYHFAVRAFSEGDGKIVKGPASNYLKIRTADPNKVTVVCKGVSDSAFKLAWTKANSATGYRIFAYLGGKWKAVKDIRSGSTLTHTFKGVNSDTVYYLRVRAFRQTASGVTWYEPSEICKAVTNPGVKDVYIYRVNNIRSIIQGDSFTFSYKTVDAKYGDIPVTISKSGESFHLSSKVNEMPYALYNDSEGSSYIILDETASYIKVPDIASGIFDVKSTMDDFLPGEDWSSKASIVTFNSQKVVCESFTNPEKTKRLKFYFKAGQFIGIDEIGVNGLEERAYVNTLTDFSDPGLFCIPDGYNRLFFGGIEDLISQQFQ